MKRPPSPDRRQFGRRDSSTHAMILVPGRPPVRCMVTNLSSGGAFLVMNERLDLPAIIRLRFEADGDERLCSVKHLNEDGVGIQFLEDCEAARHAAAQTASAARSGATKVAPAMTGASLRQEVFPEREAEKIRPLELSPGRVIRGV